MLWFKNDNNNLTSLPDSIGQLTQLNILWLDNNNLSSIPDSIGNLTELSYLSLYDNNFSQQEKDKIKKLLSNTKINF